jgi:hypothetical protein
MTEYMCTLVANYQVSYIVVTYTDPIPLPGSSLGLVPNHAYQNMSRFNAYGYETPPQFPFRPHPIDMTPPRATAEPGADTNNLTNQLVVILHESFGIEPKS